MCKHRRLLLRSRSEPANFVNGANGAYVNYIHCSVSSSSVSRLNAQNECLDQIR